MMKSLASRDLQRRELTNVQPRSHDTERRVQEQAKLEFIRRKP
jgi:hypothetical protein